MHVLDRAYGLYRALANREKVFIRRKSHGGYALRAFKTWDKPLRFFISSVNHNVVAAGVDYCVFVEEVQVALDIRVEPKHELG